VWLRAAPRGRRWVRRGRTAPGTRTLTRNTITIGDRTFDKISTPTETQQRAFNLLGAPIPLSLAS
jgi:hypothetical protein